MLCFAHYALGIDSYHHDAIKLNPVESSCVCCYDQILGRRRHNCRLGRSSVVSGEDQGTTDWLANSESRKSTEFTQRNHLSPHLSSD